MKVTSNNPILRAAALRIACLPRFVTILRYSKKIYRLYINHMLRATF